MTVKSLFGVGAVETEAPNTAVVEYLEKLLEQARDGQIRSIAAAAVKKNTDIATFFEGDQDYRLLIAGVAILQRRIMDA